MDQLIIRGGKPLRGRISVSGSKNATLPILAASLMIDGPTQIVGAPRLTDVETLCDVLKTLGTEVSRRSDRLLVEVRDDSQCRAPYELVRKMRASVCVLGPLLAKRGRAAVSLPGGCNIGDRPIDIHLRGLAALGADLTLDRGYVVGTAKRLRGAEIDLHGPRGSSVTGTANLLMAATLARGRTVLRHAAQEPEIEDLCCFLRSAGAHIDGVGSDLLEVVGVDSLTPVVHHVIPDRIEAATWMMAAAITNGDVVLDGVVVEHLGEVLATLESANVTVATLEPGTRVTAGQRRTVRVRMKGAIQSCSVTARPYPAFPTDLQAQWTALMTQASGTCRVQDDIFPGRFLHLPELVRLGADVVRDGSSAVVRGSSRLRGTAVTACDLRASAALVLAALAAEGESVIRHIAHLDRGYERLDEKLSALGAYVVRSREVAVNVSRPHLPAA